MARKPQKIKSEKIEPKAEPAEPVVNQELPDPIIISDRMLRRARPSCPECDAFPPVCTQKIRDYTGYRCRNCGHRWSEGSR